MSEREIVRECVGAFAEWVLADAGGFGAVSEPVSSGAVCTRVFTLRSMILLYRLRFLKYV